MAFGARGVGVAVGTGVGVGSPALPVQAGWVGATFVET